MGHYHSDRVKCMSEYIFLEFSFAKISDTDPRCDPILDRIDYVTNMIYSFINGDTEDDFTVYHVGYFINKVTNSISKLMRNNNNG